MPFHIQYDKDTGQIMATVEGNFIPEMKDDRKQVVFDKSVETYAKMVVLNEVVEGKVNEAGKDEETILKVDPSFEVVPSEDSIEP